MSFYKYVKERNIDFVILSDGLDLFIQKTLEKHRLSEIKFFTNRFVYKNERVFVDFINLNPECKFGTGACKCSKVKEKEFCYIGDGRSDICVGQKATLLFAKKHLREFCLENNVRHVAYENFGDILKYFQNAQNKAFFNFKTPC